jgi:Zn-dependent protease
LNPTFSLGRIAGIKIGLNWSWAIVFVLIVWSLEASVFPAQNPGLSQETYIWMAAVAALLFFGSLLLHELGHAVQARRDGVEIEGITLWLFGGVAQFIGEFPSAGAELRIALAGPAVTVVIGSVSVAVAALTHFPSAADGVLVWIGYINFVLLVFNLVPALPLDGGRVLRSLLWMRTRDFAAATRVAAGISRVLAFVLIALGVLLFVTENAFSGVWLAFIGWFLLQAAASEAR